MHSENAPNRRECGEKNERALFTDRLSGIKQWVKFRNFATENRKETNSKRVQESMSQYTIYLRVPEYLGQWLRHSYWDEEGGRVVFPRGSAPRAVLQTLLRKAPRGYREERGGEGSVAVEVPTMKGLNAATHNYLSESGRSALLSACKKLFQATLFNELHELFGHDVAITDIIYDFMERHGIEGSEKNWETIRQMYLRLRKKSQGEWRVKDG